MKLLLEDLNLDSYVSHPTSTYTYGLTIAPKIYNGITFSIPPKKFSKMNNLYI